MRGFAMTHRLRSAALGGLVVVLLAGLACGRYGPPRRIEAPAPAAPPAATATDSAPAQTLPPEPDPEFDREP
jgi:hypothetical protein